MTDITDRKEQMTETRRTAESLVLNGPDTPGKAWLLDQIRKRTGVTPEFPKIRKPAPQTSPSRDEMGRKIVEAAMRAQSVPGGGPRPFDPENDPELQPDDHIADTSKMVREPGMEG